MIYFLETPFSILLKGVSVIGSIMEQLLTREYPPRFVHDVYMPVKSTIQVINHYLFNGSFDFSSAKILVVSTTTADDAIWLSYQLENMDVQIHFLALRQSLVKNGQERMEGMKTKNISMVKSMMELPDEYYDFVCCESVLDNVSNPELVVSEVERVLKPNG